MQSETNLWTNLSHRPDNNLCLQINQINPVSGNTLSGFTINISIEFNKVLLQKNKVHEGIIVCRRVTGIHTKSCQLFLVSWGLMTRHSGLLWGGGGHRVRQQFSLILYFSKDFEECLTCIKVLNYGNSPEKSMFKDKYLPLLYTFYLIKAIILINKA